MLARCSPILLLLVTAEAVNAQYNSANGRVHDNQTILGSATFDAQGVAALSITALPDPASAALLATGLIVAVVVAGRMRSRRPW